MHLSFLRLSRRQLIRISILEYNILIDSIVVGTGHFWTSAFYFVIYYYLFQEDFQFSRIECREVEAKKGVFVTFGAGLE